MTFKLLRKIVKGSNFFKNPPSGGRPPRESSSKENKTIVGVNIFVFLRFDKKSILFL